MNNVVHTAKVQGPEVQHLIGGIAQQVSADTQQEIDSSKEQVERTSGGQRAGKSEIERDNAAGDVDGVMCRVQVCAEWFEHGRETQHANQQQHQAQDLSDCLCHDSSCLLVNGG